jgi:hypothetical protein
MVFNSDTGMPCIGRYECALTFHAETFYFSVPAKTKNDRVYV